MEYQHGGDVYSHKAGMDYSANIGPLGLPEGVREALGAGIGDCSRYPDSRCSRLRAALSEFHQVPVDALICGNGAADLIFQVVMAARPGKAVLIAPSFLEYEQALRLVDCQITYFELKESSGFALSFSELTEWLEQAEDGLPDMIFLCNPNNPTGLAVESRTWKPFLEFCRERKILCVVDECFNEFLEEPERYSILEEIRCPGYDHVFLLKAFTKIYAMAGVRLGYGICSDRDLLDHMEAVRQPWSVSSLAQAAGEAALKETKYVLETREIVRRERAYLKAQMEQLGLFVYDSMANYLFFRVRDDSRANGDPEKGRLYEACLEQGLLIRSCYNYRGLDNRYYRICVKTRQENEQFLSVFRRILEERA